MEYSRKIKQTGGLKIWNFQGCWINSKWSFQMLSKNNVEFPGVLVLGLKISEGCNTILWSFYGWSFVLYGISRDRAKRLNKVFFKNKSMSSTLSPPSHTTFFFAAIAQYGSITSSPLKLHPLPFKLALPPKWWL